MQVKHDTSYVRSLKKFEKKNPHLQDTLAKTEELLQINKDDSKLNFKKIQCKKDKNRYSIRVINTQYRILFSVFENEYRFVCICSHDKYDYYNKNC